MEERSERPMMLTCDFPAIKKKTRVTTRNEARFLRRFIGGAAIVYPPANKIRPSPSLPAALSRKRKNAYSEKWTSITSTRVALDGKSPAATRFARSLGSIDA